jgi:2-keto-4-pentenoate hydratase/2-oxohepta-3-ene-1,7-dioic acid hydratase in catechol pathway
MVARRIDETSLIPIASVADFWANPESALRNPTRYARVALDEVELVPPVLPSARVICIGLNYAEHAVEGSWEPPEYPTVFARWTASLAVDGTPVAVPPGEDGLDWEGELVVAIGRTVTRETAGDVASAVFAYAAFNDLTARRAQKLTSQWTLGKNADNSGPIGDFVTADEVGSIERGLIIETRVNGETVQSDTTASMIFPIGKLLQFLTQTMTLNPGDLIATGTPSGVGYVRNPPRLLHAGDIVDIEIERVGLLSTPVVDS